MTTYSKRAGSQFSSQGLQLVAALFLLVCAQTARAEGSAAPEAILFFEKSIRPVLVEKCLSCHGEKSQFANLRLDSRAAMLKGGDSGPVIDLEHPEKSRLLTVLEYMGAIKMPPSGRLTDRTVADFAAWIRQGSPWPAALAARSKTMAERVREARGRLWSLQPVRKPALPAVKNRTWANSPIDRIVLARLEAKGLTPAPDADRVSLIRRATYDLTGLPPTTAETSSFLTDHSPNAFEKVVDRLLASPQYGERWGRHWLDVARYSDTLGYLVGNVGDAARIYPYAYTYRDYVVRAFNADKPYDQFVKEQLAADLLPVTDRRDLAALGFITIGNRYLGNNQEIIDDRIDVVTRGLQAMTVGCARCHDHKFDPIPTADYYALYGVFDSIHEPQDLPQIDEPADRKAYQAFLQKVAPLEQKRAQMRREKKDDEANKIGEQIKAMALNDPGAPPRAMVVQDNDTPSEPHVLLRGNPGTPGALVPRQFLAAVEGEDRRPFTRGSGRLELAERIASPTNPLTARVLVNRVWMHHFGRPLVNTPSDFGMRGEAPVQPELLDYLAASFMEAGWSLKRLHRQIMLSHVYRQSSDAPAITVKRDPENRLLGRMNRQRMEFEPLRDTLLSLSGDLDRTVGGRPIPALFADNRRRTLYAFVDRQDLPGVLRSFDFADPGAHSPMRSVTTVPQQALFLMNNPFVRSQIQRLLARPEITAASSPAARVQALCRAVYGRSATSAEIATGVAFVSRWKSRPRADNATAAWQNGYGEYRPDKQRVAEFTPLPFFTGQAWQGGAQLPDAKLGWVTLRADGGHPGDDQHCAIRRWTAPADMTVAIQGRLEHPAEQGNGVEAMVVSSRAGLLGSWTAHHSSADVRLAQVIVRRGETIDFVLSCRGDVNSDSFSWAPLIETIARPAAQSAAQSRWDAAADFSGPTTTEAGKPMSAWEVYTQALLLTNEFLFID